MAGWHHQLNAHESEQARGAGDGQGGLACCSPWGRKESDTTERLKNNKRQKLLQPFYLTFEVSFCFNQANLFPDKDTGQ